MDSIDQRDTAPRTELGSGPRAGGRGESGAAMVLALLVTVILTLLGLAFLMAGETESKISVNQRDFNQATYVAEGGVRMIKHWFDAPSGTRAYLVPTTAQMDRTLRWVDPEGDGTYTAYASAAPPWNVLYREGTDDPFEKPYRGSPAKLFLGPEDHPDIRVAEDASTEQRAFLDTLNETLYPDFPSHGQRVRIRQIDVYAPPVADVSGQRVRLGIATVKVTVGIHRYAGTASESRVAERIVKAVLNEAPYATGPMGPLQSCVSVHANGNFSAHWGPVTSSGDMTLHNNLNEKMDSGVPRSEWARIIAPDLDGDGILEPGSDGTAADDDRDGDGSLDFDQWIASAAMEDPWLQFWSEGNIDTNGGPLSPDCSDENCQPIPWYSPSVLPPPPGTLAAADVDHSNMFKNVTMSLCPQFPYALWKQVALSGGANVHYYASDGAGSTTYKLFGSGPSVTMRDAVDGKTGFFFFDTATNSEPVDVLGDGTYDNLAPPVALHGGDLTTGGFIYLNADLRTTGTGNPAYPRTLVAPAEPYLDADGDGEYDPAEYFLDMTYSTTPVGGFVKHGLRREIDGFTRQDPSIDAATDGQYASGINMYGVLFTNGTYDAQGNWLYFGAVVTRTGMYANGGAGTPVIFFDERLVKGLWPPAELGLPRTIISAWETDL